MTAGIAFCITKVSCRADRAVVRFPVRLRVAKSEVHGQGAIACTSGGFLAPREWQLSNPSFQFRLTVHPVESSG
jgi:hypothetical protein